jgi:hypothetical protein
VKGTNVSKYPSTDLPSRSDFAGIPQRDGHQAKILDDQMPGETAGLELSLALDGELGTYEPGKPAFDGYTLILDGTNPVRLVGLDVERTRLTITHLRLTSGDLPMIAVGHYSSLNGGTGGTVLPPLVPVELNTTDEVWAMVSQQVPGTGVTPTSTAWVSVLIERIH